MGAKKLKVLHENCDKEKANDTSLPYTAYLVTYKVDGKERYDISIAQKAVDLFDYYYDLYKKDFVKFTQAAGRVAPNMWQNPADKPKKTAKQKPNRR